MKRINGNAVFPLLALIILTVALSRQMFSYTSFGKLLDPFTGVVQNENEAALEKPLSNFKIGLSDSVSVFFDSRKVPHIYANNETDLYYAQGYVTASLRLWQMDFISYLSAGRLAEIFGQSGWVDYDRIQRRSGIPGAARNAVALMLKDEETNKVLSAYTKGVNAYISSLTYKTMPFEYKFLDYKPEPWTVEKTALVMKYMGNTLAGYEEDFGMSKLMLVLGEEKFNRLFPEYSAHMTPMVNYTASKGQPLVNNIKKPDYLDFSFVSTTTVVPPSTYNPKLGSNSWAVSGKKTKSGRPILCSDPHLNLVLPAIWLEIQLTCPGVNVYGVSIPGTPAVIIGFNEQIAWGITNGTDDVKDWYKLKIKEDYSKYMLDGNWQDLTYTIEEIKIRGSLSMKDTVYKTVHGPVMFTRQFPGNQPDLLNHAARWELLNPSNEFLCFIKLSKAANYNDFTAAIAGYSAPLQNFTFAGKSDTIALFHQGKLPVKFPGQGKFVMDGTSSKYVYKAYIPTDSLPHVVNPASNYVVSANQRPADSNYNYYYNGYFSENRAGRINQLLEADNQFDIEKMKTMQLDNTYTFAREAVPVLLSFLQNAKLTAAENEANKKISGWKGQYDRDDTEAQLFQLWWDNCKNYTWDELKTYQFQTKFPDDYLLLDLMKKDPADIYFDKLATQEKEEAGSIVIQAFKTAVVQYENDKQTKGVKWSDVNRVSMMHLTNIWAFSKTGLPSAGFPEAINACSNNWGPSWRMIVELGERPVAWGIYPGGQSGNIGSPYSDNFITDWNKGTYYSLQFFLTKAEAIQHTSCKWQLN